MNLFTAFARAAANLPLTPQERAWLKLVWGAVVTGLVAAVGVLSTLLSTGQFTFNHQTALAVGVTGFVACLNALAKLMSAQGDPALGAALAAIAGDVASKAPAGPLHSQADPATLPPAPAEDGSAI